MKELEPGDLYQKIFDNAVMAIGVTNLGGDYVMVNKAWCKFLGYTQEEAKGLNVQDLTAPDELGSSADNFSKLISGELDFLQRRRRYKRKDGSIFWAELYVSRIHNDQGDVSGVLGIFIDIDQVVKSEKGQNELNAYLEKLSEDLENAHNAMKTKNQELTEAYEHLNRLSRHDALTGLYNRRTLDEVVASEILRSTRTKRGFALAIADIDNFKKFNDNFGHDCGDEVLKTVSRVFLDKIRKMDYVGRWGGEEFLFVFPETHCKGAEIVLDRVREGVEATKVIHNGLELQVTITIGFSYHRNQLAAEEMIVEADKALYQGKAAGKNRVICYQPECLIEDYPEESII